MSRNLFALFGAVAVLLSATVALTLSRATVSASGVGNLKCYDVKGIEKACRIWWRARSAAQFISALTPYANAKTSGAAQQKVATTSAVMRSIGRLFATCIK